MPYIESHFCAADKTPPGIGWTKSYGDVWHYDTGQKTEDGDAIYTFGIVAPGSEGPAGWTRFEGRYWWRITGDWFGMKSLDEPPMVLVHSNDWHEDHVQN